MLERFELVPDKQTPYLSFEGFFEPSLFSQIQIIPGDKKTETSVILPNTFINNIFFAEPEITSVSYTHLREKSDSRRITFSMQKLKKMLISTIEKGEVAAQEQTVPQAEADVIFWSVFTPRMVNKREKILLHPVTALMSYRQFDQLNVAILNASQKTNGRTTTGTCSDCKSK